MQQLVQDMKELEHVLEPFCEEIISWKGHDLYGQVSQVMEPITTMVTLILNNKDVFEGYGISVDEDGIIQCLGKLTKALENTDDVLLLDGLYMEFLPWLRERRKAITTLLANL